MAEEKDENKEEIQPKKSPLKFIILGVMVIVLGAAGFLGWNLFMKGEKEETQISQSPPQSQEEKPKIIYPLETFIVNLMDKAGLGKRYLRVTIELEVSDEKAKRKLETHKTQLRDAALVLLSSHSFSEISTVEGKIDLKQELMSRVNQVLGEGIVHRLYFTDFVVQ